MNASEHIQPQHLGRQALVYIRQSTPSQMLRNQESLDLQYALRGTNDKRNLVFPFYTIPDEPTSY